MTHAGPAAPRRFAGDRLVVASHNKGKVSEISDLLAPLGIEAVAASALGLPEPEETGDSFIANAELKALAAARASQLPALADDSGLCVTALGDAPGLYSARWAGPDRDFSKAMKQVADALLMGQNPDRSARFVCALSLAWPDGHADSFEGRVHGRIIWPPRGDRGFGYDPIFLADGQALSFGEMDPVKKHAISHRADAFAQLLAACFADHPPR